MLFIYKYKIPSVAQLKKHQFHDEDGKMPNALRLAT